MTENYRRSFIHSTNIYWAHYMPHDTLSTRNAGVKDSIPPLGHLTLKEEKQTT